MKLAIFVLALVASGCARTSLSEPPAPVTNESEFARFRREHDYENPDRWVSIEVSKSAVTETRRRIYFEKEAVTQALLAHEGGEGKDAAPMHYANGAVFVAESITEDGTRRDTEALTLRPESGAMFKLFDHEGQRSFTFAQPNDPPSGPVPGNVPAVCVNCHLGSDFFEPMMSFPSESTERRVIIDSKFRNATIVSRFLEGLHRGDQLFGPYGAIWLSMLAAKAADGRISTADAPYYNRLRVKYGDLLPPRAK